MTYQKDGSAFHTSKGKIIPNIYYYGWLSRLIAFEKSKEKQEYKAFKELADRVNHRMMCGYHICEFCGWENSNYGNGEMWLKVKGKTYIFPRMIWHYIKDHDYELPTEIYNSVNFGKYEILTDQNIIEIFSGKSAEIIDAPYLVFRALWKRERYENMGEFFNRNHLKYFFNQAFIQDEFYVAEMYLLPTHIAILFEDDPENFPDKILIVLEPGQNIYNEPS